MTAAAAAANPAVSLLLQRLPVDSVLFPPFRPRQASRGAPRTGPRSVCICPVPLYLFPLVSGYVGGDLVAFLCGQFQAPGSFYLDVGTNGEMAWCDGERWWTTSVAAGPAFEGGEISCGMGLERGAVTAVRVAGDRLRLEVYRRRPAPRPVRQRPGLGHRRGPEGGPDRRRRHPRRAAGGADQPCPLPGRRPETGRALRLYRDARTELLLTQQDIRNFQLAKGAVHAGAECLLKRAGARPEQVAAVVVTGAFGLSLTPADLKRVAMLPSDMVDKVRFTPGGALAGVGRMLLEEQGRVSGRGPGGPPAALSPLRDAGLPKRVPERPRFLKNRPHDGFFLVSACTVNANSSAKGFSPWPSSNGL